MPGASRRVLVAVAIIIAVAAGTAVAATRVIGPADVPTESARRLDPPYRAVVVGDSAISALRWVPRAEGAVVGFEHTLDLESCRRLWYRSCYGREGRLPPTVYEALDIHGPKYSTLVVATGYNDGSPGFGDSFTAVVGRARQLGYTRIVWWTLRSDVDYVSPGSISNHVTFAANNRTVVDLLATGAYPDVVLADWGGYTADKAEWFVTDGVHYRAVGAWAAADYLTRKMAYLEGRACPVPDSPTADVADPCPDPDVTGPVADIEALYPIGEDGVLCYEVGEERRFECRNDTHVIRLERELLGRHVRRRCPSAADTPDPARLARLGRHRHVRPSHEGGCRGVPVDCIVADHRCRRHRNPRGARVRHDRHRGRRVVSLQRWAWAEIDVDAIRNNVELLRQTVEPSRVWAVVKADGYGHGAVRVARAALAGGAEGLCVALVDEGVELRRAGVEAPILLLTEQPPAQLADVVRFGLIPTLYSPVGIRQLAAALQSGDAEMQVHVNVDTGMQRVGVSVDEAPALVRRITDQEAGLRLAGIYTHLACADEPSSPASTEQLGRFDAVLERLDADGSRPPLIHVANSAAALAIPSARRSLVRAGIAIYGISPGPGVDHLTDGLRPALSLKARVAYVKRVAAGSAISYGWRHHFESETTVATLPLGYADGVPRRLGTLPDRPGADVLIGARRCPIVGVVTMDQLMVDVGDADVEVGDEAVLIGEQGGQHIRAEHWADRLGTIGYEIVCGISTRIPRVERGTVPERVNRES